ncbi:MAG TPA: adenylate kinase [Dysgonamonadaceae bacterium]|jgi:adenylate kinase|nr:adenylate kinase [Dysgonamonadaceae bacterium]
MLNIVIFGAPGSGKGTQSEKLIEKYHLTHLSTGDILRNEIKNNTELGELASKYMAKGQLVPDSVVIEMLDKLFDQHPDNVGYIFDGFPRTLPQGEALDAMLSKRDTKINLVLSLEVDDEHLTERLINRGEVSGRNDDTPETIKSRLQVYYNQTAPLKEYYTTRDKLVKIDGLGTVEEIFARIEKIVDKIDY